MRATIEDLARLLLLVVALIIYGCLFPWQFVHRPGSDPVRFLLHSWYLTADRFVIRDVAVNIALYVPLGVFGYLTFCRRMRNAGAAAVTALLGLLLSTSIEIAQFYDAGRVPSLVDVATNFAGTILGILIAMMASNTIRRHAGRIEPAIRRAPAAALILSIWIFVRLYPFFPALSRTALIQKIHILFTTPFLVVPFVTGSVVWFCVGHLLSSLRLSRLWLAASFAVFPAQFLLLYRQPVWPEFLGAVCGAVLYIIAGTTPMSIVLLAFLLQSVLLIRGLAPFHFSDAPHPFHWIPFGASLESQLDDAVAVLADKCFYYGAAVWAVWRCGASLRVATLLTMLILGFIEGAQRYLPGRTPEITDPLLACLIGTMLFAVNTGRRSSPAGQKS